MADDHAPVRAQEPPIDIMDALHHIFTVHGIASRSDSQRLVTDVVSWAAKACRQSPVSPQEPATAKELIDETLDWLSRLSKNARTVNDDHGESLAKRADAAYSLICDLQRASVPSPAPETTS